MITAAVVVAVPNEENDVFSASRLLLKPADFSNRAAVCYDAPAAERLISFEISPESPFRVRLWCVDWPLDVALG